ncbi:TonB-dependent receptor [Sphingomicrobium aestuariivivum]|uniref:TonB-dependent receptor n=1 Tax=Sphingomicrobium aestuariivivum TaxID=1582356 RepID=UPI001FD6A4A7|nr:TonB-dependent receptor [Sphingomicrobium aestuariivivum]MCJ8192043.1 TonB-dependent receptor [Sphingomicrobium aestuariivivum]
MMTTLAVASALLATPATTQDAAADDGRSPSRPLSAEELDAALGGPIIITARRREELLQDTPIAVSAFTAEALAARGVDTSDALANITPNLTFRNNPAFGGLTNNAAIFIRGIGQSDFVPTIDPGVGVYVDGVYLARSVGSVLDLVDIERVEVLRGPQGTLFGRNTIGGAISITTSAPNPSREEGHASFAYGTDDLVEAKASYNIPLGEDVAMRLAGGYFGQDGYVYRPFDDRWLGNSNRFVGRAALRAYPSDTVTLDLALDYTHLRENGAPYSLVGINYGTTLAAPPFVDIHNVLANLMAGGGPMPCATAAMPYNPDVDGCLDDRYVAGRFTNLGTGPTFSDSDIFGFSLIGEWDVADDLTLKSISAYRTIDSAFARDGDVSPFTVNHFADELSQYQYSQELQLLGRSFDRRLDWIIGGYFFRETGTNPNILDFVVSRFRSGGAFEGSSIAGFAQGTFDVTDSLSLTAGIRYTEETKSFTPDQVILENKLPFLPPFDAPIFAPGTRILPNVEATRRYDAFTPHLNIAFRPSEPLLLYASWSEGFKSGGFTQRVFPPIIPGITTPILDPAEAIPSIAPETVSTYEVGAKYNSPGGLLRLNVAAFSSDYKDLQIQVFTSVAPVFQNAASASIKGFEAEMQLDPGGGFFAEASLGYTDAGYEEIDEAVTFVDPDNDLALISRWTVAAGAQHRFDLSPDQSLTPRVDLSYRSGYYTDAFNTEAIAQDDYALLDANVAWRDDKRGLALIGSVHNVFDTHYLVSGVLSDAFQVFEGAYARGREAKLSLEVDF